jgi:hypothetical protein
MSDWQLKSLQYEHKQDESVLADAIAYYNSLEKNDKVKFLNLIRTGRLRYDIEKYKVGYNLDEDDKKYGKEYVDKFGSYNMNTNTYGGGRRSRRRRTGRRRRRRTGRRRR